MTERTRRRAVIATAIALLAIGALAIGMRAALAALERSVVAALGPGTTIGAIHATTTAIEVEQLRIPGGPDWPAPDTLRAERVRIVPTWASLVSGRIAIARVEIEAPYLSMLRPRGGGLRVLPTLLHAAPPATAPEATASTAGAPAGAVRIDEIRVHGGTLEIFDATVARRPWPVRVDALDARMRDVVAPGLAGRMPFELRGVLDGPQRDGTIALGGWIDVATSDLELRADLAGIDLLALEPYLIEASKARLERGTLDLALAAKVASRKLDAPGRLTLADLAFADTGSASAHVMGVPRDLLLAALQAKGGRIALDFTVAGDVDDPRFSLDEAISTRVAVALAKELGVGVGGLVESTLELGLEGVEGAGRAAGGVGSVLKKLLPGR